jgi:RNA polymerase sigma-70 factor (ECF subfamily)
MPEPGSEAEAKLPETPRLYDEHADFVWRSLAHLGITEADREDLLQEVFVVVHRTRDEYRGEGKVTTWLYGITLRIASRHRRWRRVRSEISPPSAGGSTLETPEGAASTRQRADLATRLMDELSEDKRSVFILFELQGLSCQEIAEALAVPVGTVYSRLHAARAQFRLAWQQLEECPPRNQRARSVS